MALPHMPSSYTTRKNIYEAAIVRRRMQDDDLRESWQDTAKYFNRAELHSSKDAAWTSKATFQSSMDAYKKNYAKDTKALNLSRRRSKLASLYHDESLQYEAELKGYSLDNYGRISQMKERSEALKSAREEERRQIADERLYAHFRQNCPDIRKLESEQHKEHVVEQWADQKEERLLAAEEERMEKEEADAAMERERLEALAQQRRAEQRRLENERELKEILKQQMNELKRREQETEIIKKQQEELLKHQWELERIEEDRKRMEEEHKKKELGRVLLRQHTAALKRKSRQVLEELEQDRRILESILEKENEEITLRTARKQEARADAAWMKEVIEDQMRLEKEREAELDMLYQEEASRIWSEREDEWRREREARQRLMQDVLAGRQEQIREKMAELRKKQQESLERREELIKDMEKANEMTQREREQTQRQKEQQREEIGAQISTRMTEKERGVVDEIAQLEIEKKAEQDYDELLRQEANNLRLKGYQPQIHSRRGKSAWQ
ncbi:trichoplein keratin filament-binding protein-like [Watersipora subatra]|uniref:trichoplein keratin filament-binding protein-like n=1 Tax=Watersipora subatra TaxID=2589382 RepID=UPI00355C95C7